MIHGGPGMDMGPRMDAVTLMRQADRRIEADLDAMRADVEEALAGSEGDPSVVDQGPLPTMRVLTQTMSARTGIDRAHARGRARS
jgi:hypothetical protein